ncbi:hypothetical protein L218DRAFT_750549 [Marasmius fiardii PR-910]|nr:hypothetical protein L218DRAFT_750549 [Marasmius fiardii PR-910]
MLVISTLSSLPTIMSEIEDSLQKEFCPPLDTSLVLALLSDIDLKNRHEVDSIRETLCQLASVEDDEEASYPSETETPPTSILDSSAVDFLRTVLPHIPPDRLRKAVTDAEVEDGSGESDIDMWEVIAGLLTEETLREMEERGLDWETRKDQKGKQKLPKVKPTTITFSLADIRQQHRVSSISSSTSTNEVSVDPWTQINSLSTYLSTLLAPQEPSYFQSYFHSPEYESPYDAVLAAVFSISEKYKEQDVDPVALVSLLDFLLPTTTTTTSSPDITPISTSGYASTVELCLKAANGRSDDALDLVVLLQDLAIRGRKTEEGSVGEIGVYHTNPNTKTKKPLSVSTTTESLLPLPEPSPTRIALSSDPSWTLTSPKPKQKPRPSPPRSAWQTVPFSARNSNNSGRNATGVAAGGDDLRAKIEENLRRRNEMLRQASKMWRVRGGGGGGAMYFAERAREFQELARKDSLSAARILVETNSRRFNNPSTSTFDITASTVDLHGTTVLEATQIILEMLEGSTSTSTSTSASASTPRRPLKLPVKIITGRGTHSRGRISVLKPAVKKALVDRGWVVSEWEGGLVVRGR